MFEEAIGKTIIDPAIMGSLKEGVIPKAPGMKYKHYAPNADVTIVEGPHEKVVQYINSQVSEKKKQKVTDVQLWQLMRQKINIYAMILFQQDIKDDELSVARNLYAIIKGL